MPRVAPFPGLSITSDGLIPQALRTSSRDTLNSSTSAAVGSGPTRSGFRFTIPPPAAPPQSPVSSSATLPAMFRRSWRSCVTVGSCCPSTGIA